MTPATAAGMTTSANLRMVVPSFIRRVGQTRREYERGIGRATTRSAPRNVAVGRGVRVEYTPELDGDADPGEVVWSWVPFEDEPTRGKDRPVVIIGRSGDDFAAVPLTSRYDGQYDHVPVGTGEWDPKRRPSWAKADRLLMIDPGDVRCEGSVLPRDRFDLVVAAASRHHPLVRT